MSEERNAVIKAVVDRVNSYQESAPEGTVAAELREALTAAGVEMSDDEITDLVAEIENGEWSDS